MGQEAPAGERQTMRERHTEVTRDAIMGALADIIAESGVHNFTVQQVADRAGVSHRTVYRHFPTRDALMEGVSGWLEEQWKKRGAPGVPSSADEIVEGVALVYRLFDEYDPLVRALAIAYATTEFRPEVRDERTRGFERAFREAVPGADEQTVRRLFLAGRALAGTQTWLFFREHMNVSGAEAGDAVQWAIRVLIDAARQEATAARDIGADGATPTTERDS
ncbi:MAG: TetR/AcrR family transcriptional regulator [Dehalococcoidia bacterium]|nr:TetR/AcrR family transcriptional regulator [Dehalococcoidia bacterium]